jgi:multiple sugar transport system substrate-binding protein
MNENSKRLSRRDFLRLSAAGAASAALASSQFATVLAKGTVSGELSAIPAAQSEGTLVWFTLHAADHLPAFQQQLSMFKATHPNVTIQELFVPGAEFTTKLPTLLAAGEQVDVVWLQTQVGIAPNAVDYWVRRDLLLDMTPVFDSSTMPRQDFFEGILNLSEIDGKLWGVPFEIPMFVMWYNATLLNEAGVGLPDNTWTWEDHHEAARAATKVEGGRTLQYGSMGIPWNMAVAQAGAVMVSQDGEQVNLDTPEFRAGIQEWYHYYENGYAPVGGDTSVFSGLQSGNVAINITGTWMWNTFRQVADELGFDFGASVMPAGPGTAPLNWATMGGTNAWCVLNTTQYPELATEFAVHLGYGPGAEPWAATGRISPVKRFDVAYYQTVGGFNDVEKARYARMLETAFAHMDAGALMSWAEPFSYNERAWRDVATIIDEELSKVTIDKSQTIDQAIETAIQRVNTMIDEAG